MKIPSNSCGVCKMHLLFLTAYVYIGRPWSSLKNASSYSSNIPLSSFIFICGLLKGQFVGCFPARCSAIFELTKIYSTVNDVLQMGSTAEKKSYLSGADRQPKL